MTEMPPSRHKYLNTRDAARHLNLKESTLNCWRSRQSGPAFVKAGGRVVYRLEDLEAWADGRRRDPSARR